ncbi:hypothetical protein Hsw_0597 [Hymenobacter swuensis DY53]|uniref:RagB/SusD domain-containing protein n=1 Tax=Hymenobacter swuensis DY53 TaxID=1227739 RepID=W8EWM9_9BACT|nr:hypothetical protein Hsw_0597 [Hymenobacter swuensis DY53]
MNNMYDYMKAGAFLGGRYQVYGDIRANDFLHRNSNQVTGDGVWQHILTESSQNDVINMWGAGYAAINQINVFLAGMDANSAKFTAAPFPADYPATATTFVAEGRMLRALAYYSLLQYYARPYADGNGSRPGLPLRLQAETELGNNDLARSTVAQVYDQILTDLQFAETNLPLTNSAGNVFRAHRNTAIALKTRVLLSMGRYADVVTEAGKMVPTAAPFRAPTGVAHELNPSLAAVFAPAPAGTEMILAFPFTAQDPAGVQNQLAFYFLPNPQGGQEYNLNPEGVIASPNFKATDARLTTLLVRSGTPASPYLRKYTTGTQAAVPYTDAAPVIRYAEVLLNLSEGLARSQGVTNARALELLNAVRTRSGSDAYTAASFTGTFSIIDAILLERRLEFLGEGLRNNDDMRLLRTIAAKGTINAIPSTDPRYIWPIPSSELQTNTLITRN